MTDQSTEVWQTRDRFLALHSRWMTLIGEHLEDPQGNLLDYWRIEKADSVIVLPIQGDRILLSSPTYRPGIGQVTLDFPGGRVPAGQTPEQGAISTLKRELGFEAASIMQLLPLNTEGWAVNSSFSNQKLYGFVAHLDNSANPSGEGTGSIDSVSLTDVQNLLQKLTCLQCRVVLLEWWLNS
ncbi:MAG: NUDIX domain-containing protein [Kovacikia sp.]